MKNNKNLNPLNDPEVAEMLTMSPEDQLWSFLDDCVPQDGKDAILVMMGDQRRAVLCDDNRPDFRKERRRTVVNVPDKAVRKVFCNPERVLHSVFYRMLYP